MTIDAFLAAIELCSERAKNRTPLNFRDLTELRSLLNHDRSQNPKELEREIDSINTKLQNLEHAKVTPFMEICELLGSVSYNMQNYSDERVPQILVNYILQWFGQAPVDIPPGKKTLNEWRGYFAEQLKESLNLRGKTYIRKPDFDPENGSIPYTSTDGEEIIVEWHALNRNLIKKNAND